MAEVFDFGLQQHKIKMDGKFFESNLFAVAGDTGRRLEVQLLDSNNMIQNTTGISLRLNANVAGQATYAEATLVDATKGLYELDLPNGMLIAPGNWQFQWQIIGTSGEKLHSFAFTGSVGSNLSEGGIEATNFYLNVDDLKQMQEDLINGTFDSEVLETNIAEKLNNLEEQYAPRLTEVTAQLAQTDMGSIEAYGKNITRDNFFNGDAKTGLDTAWSDRQILIMGDSHDWGEGSPNYQGISAGYSLHSPWIHNKSFGGRLVDYLYKKFDSEPWRVIPLFNKINPIPVSGAGAVANLATNNKPHIDETTFTKTPRIVKGKYFITRETYLDSNATARPYLNIFHNAETKDDAYSQAEYKSNADVGLLGAGKLFFAPDSDGKSAVCFEMEKPSRYAILHLPSGYNAFGKCKIELLDDSNKKNDGTDDFEQVVTGFGNPVYGTAVPKVSVLNGLTIDSSLVTPPNVTINANNIIIDASYPGMSFEATYIIDFKQKKKGTVRLSHAGAGVNTTSLNSVLGSSAIATRGILFGNRDLVRNWAMGGHTIGAWLGEEGNWNNAEIRDHLTDALKYMTGGLKGAVIQVPLVNERIKQTPIATFKTRLSTLKTRLKTDNILMFTSIGEKSYEFGTATSPIDYEDYNIALKEWVDSQGGNVTFIDCGSYIKNLVKTGVVPDFNDLYINDAHPSPMVNELIFSMLKKAVDMKY